MFCLVSSARSDCMLRCAYFFYLLAHSITPSHVGKCEYWCPRSRLFWTIVLCLVPWAPWQQPHNLVSVTCSAHTTERRTWSVQAWWLSFSRTSLILFDNKDFGQLREKICAITYRVAFFGWLPSLPTAVTQRHSTKKDFWFNELHAILQLIWRYICLI